MKKKLTVLVIISLVTVVATAVHAASEEEFDLLKDRVAQLEAARANTQSNGLHMYWKEGIRMDSADGAFKLKLGGRLMTDFGWIKGHGLENDLGVDLEDGAEIRRARLYIAGTIYDNIAFKAQFDFAGGDADMKDVYVQFLSLPFVGTVTIGHFKEPFSLENLTSSKYITFMERSLANVFAPGRNMGVMASNHAMDKRVTWAVGLFRDVDDFGIGNADGGNAYSVTGRVTGLPVYEDGGRRLVHVGASYSLRHPEDPVRYRERPEAHFIPERFTDTGSFNAEWINLFGAEAAAVYGPFSIQGEYVGVSATDANTAPGQETLCLNSWYVYGSYFITGESRPYDTKKGIFKRVKPKQNFNLSEGGWGAWEVAVRYSMLDLDTGMLPDTARTVHDVTAGINWYLNPNVRFMLNYIRSCVDGADTSSSASILMARAQVDF